MGAYFAGHYPAAGSFLLLILAGIVVGASAGLIVERGLLRPMYGRDEVVLVLVTYAAFLVFEDLIKLVWGVDPYFAYQPYELLGRVSIGGIGFAAYDLGLFALAIVIGVAAWWALERTRSGKLLRAVIYDREISTAMGINVARMFTATFVIGAILGALGGAITAPAISVVPGIGVDVIVLAFAVSIIGGLGSVAGAAIGALVVGLARACAVHLLPEVELFVIYAVMATVLAFRPQGLFGRPAARKSDMRSVPILTLALAALLGAGPLMPSWLVFLLTVAFAKGLVVLGLLVMMRAGLVSFGQGLYYGLGAYTAGLATNFLGVTDAIALVVLGGLVSAVAGYVLGFIMARYREIFFAMLSLALSMILYGILVRSAALGSTDGFNLPPPNFFGFAVDGQTGRLLIYALTIITAAGAAIGCTAS